MEKLIIVPEKSLSNLTIYPPDEDNEIEITISDFCIWLLIDEVKQVRDYLNNILNDTNKTTS